MLDVQLLRNDLGVVADRLAARGGYRLDVDSFKKLEERRRALQSATESLQAQRNALSKQIGVAKRNKDQQSAESLMAQVNGFAADLKHNEDELDALRREMEDLLLGIPNLPHESVPPDTSPCSSGLRPTSGPGATPTSSPTPCASSTSTRRGSTRS